MRAHSNFNGLNQAVALTDLPGQWLCVRPDGSVQVRLIGRNTSSQPAFL